MPRMQCVGGAEELAHDSIQSSVALRIFAPLPCSFGHSIITFLLIHLTAQDDLHTIEPEIIVGWLLVKLATSAMISFAVSSPNAFCRASVLSHSIAAAYVYGASSLNLVTVQDFSPNLFQCLETKGMCVEL